MKYKETFSRKQHLYKNKFMPFLSILFLFIIITGCSTEEYYTKNNEHDLINQKVYELNSNKSPFKEKDLYEYLNKINQSKDDWLKKGKDKVTSISLGTKVVENKKGDYTSYTIALKDSTLREGEFKNLLIERTKTKEAVYLVTLTPTKQYIRTLSLLGEGSIDYEGGIDAKILSFKDKELDLSNGRMVCTHFVSAGLCGSGKHDYAHRGECTLAPHMRPRPRQDKLVCVQIEPWKPDFPPRPTHPRPTPPSSGGNDTKFNGIGDGYGGTGGSGDNKKKEGHPKYVCLNDDCSKVKAIDPVMIAPLTENDFLKEGKTDFIEAIITEGIQDEPSLMDIYNKLGRVEGIQKILDGFREKVGDNSFGPRVADLFFYGDKNFHFNSLDKIKDYKKDTRAYTSYTVEKLSANYIKIYINFNTDPNSDRNIYSKPKIATVVTFLHELMHAEMFLYLWKKGEITKYKCNEKKLLELLNNKNGKLIDIFSDVQDLNHSILAEIYRETIINALLQMYPNKLTKEEASALAWVGLHNSKAYKEKMKNNPNFEKEIEDTNEKTYKKIPEICHPKLD